jgi:aspartate carbamoyltransferase
VQRLGGSVVNITSETSSVAKGETLGDTVRTLESYADAVVLRHPRLGSAAEAASVMRKPLLNAGDGAGEHPTQALLDLYTVLRCARGHQQEQPNQPQKGVTNITFLGDAKNGRTVHSLAKLLAMYAPKQFRVRYVTPQESLVMPQDLVKSLTDLGLVQSEHTTMTDEDVLANTDVLYVTRVQKERFEDLDTYEKAKKSFLVDQASLARFGKSANLIVMHPLPRVGEIAEDVDKDPRAQYFAQMENGMYVRMALLTLVLGGHVPAAAAATRRKQP